MIFDVQTFEDWIVVLNDAVMGRMKVVNGIRETYKKKGKHRWDKLERKASSYIGHSLRVCSDGSKNVLHVSLPGWAYEDKVPKVVLKSLDTNGVNRERVKMVTLHIGINSMRGSLITDKTDEERKVDRKRHIDSFEKLLFSVKEVFPGARIVYFGTSSVRRARVQGDDDVFPSKLTTTNLLKKRNGDINLVMKRIKGGAVKMPAFEFLNLFGGCSDADIVDRLGHVSGKCLTSMVRKMSDFLLASEVREKKWIYL